MSEFVIFWGIVLTVLGTIAAGVGIVYLFGGKKIRQQIREDW